MRFSPRFTISGFPLTDSDRLHGLKIEFWQVRWFARGLREPGRERRRSSRAAVSCDWPFLLGVDQSGMQSAGALIERGKRVDRTRLRLAAPCSGDISAISPAVRMTSALIHFSLVVSTVVIASPMRRRASEGHPLRRSAAQHIELVAKKDFSLQSHPRPE